MAGDGFCISDKVLDFNRDLRPLVKSNALAIAMRKTSHYLAKAVEAGTKASSAQSPVEKLSYAQLAVSCADRRASLLHEFSKRKRRQLICELNGERFVGKSLR